MNRRGKLQPVSGLLFATLLFSCAGGKMGNDDPQAQDICACTPDQPIQGDYRHNAKHVPLPSGAGTSITVSDILEWPVGPEPAADAPRQGRELQLYHIEHAFLRLATVKDDDCDLHLEISETQDREAPRVIVETPQDSEYCSSRRKLNELLAELGEQLNLQSGELKQPRPVNVVGLAFQDSNHPRGSEEVATVWELHPAIVKLLPE